MSRSRYRGLVVLLMDVCLIFFFNFAMFFSYLMDGNIQLYNLVMHIGLLTVCVLVFQLWFKTYDTLWRYAESQEYLTLLKGMGCGFLLYSAVNIILGTSFIWISEALKGTALALIAMLAIRFLYRKYRRRVTSIGAGAQRYTAIIGAGSAGVALLGELNDNVYGTYKPYCLIDDSREKQRKRIHGVSVIGPIDNTVELLANTPVTDIILAINNTTTERKREILDIAENTTYELQNDLVHLYGRDFPLSVEIASVRDKARMEQIFAKYRPQLVLHAAAHKHVPLMEDCPGEAIKNNVFGTYNAACTAREFGTEKFVLISTDKAVNPTNVMGATKCLCEQVLQSLNGGETEFAAVRFGNVLGSNGSVIPLFKKQIAYGGPVTITDRRIIRYFMTIPEAAQLVLEAGSFAHRGEVFVLDMGEPVRIADLADKLIRLSGYVPGRDIEIKEVGLRPGEKLYEELLMSNDNLHKTENEKIFVEERPAVDEEMMKRRLDELKATVALGNNEEILAALHKLVPTFRRPEEVNKNAEQVNAQCAKAKCRSVGVAI